MNILFTILVTFFAGMGAGLGTGFAGMSAAAVISPMLITYLHMDPYMAVGIALSSDVLASAVSAYKAEDGTSKTLLTVDLTEEYQALYPEAGITKAVRREYTSANAK